MDDIEGASDIEDNESVTNNNTTTNSNYKRATMDNGGIMHPPVNFVNIPFAGANLNLGQAAASRYELSDMHYSAFNTQNLSSPIMLDPHHNHHHAHIITAIIGNSNEQLI